MNCQKRWGMIKDLLTFVVLISLTVNVLSKTAFAEESPNYIKNVVGNFK